MPHRARLAVDLSAAQRAGAASFAAHRFACAAVLRARLYSLSPPADRGAHPRALIVPAHPPRRERPPALIIPTRPTRCNNTLPFVIPTEQRFLLSSRPSNASGGIMYRTESSSEHGSMHGFTLRGKLARSA